MVGDRPADSPSTPPRKFCGERFIRSSVPRYILATRIRRALYRAFVDRFRTTASDPLYESTASVRWAEVRVGTDCVG